MELIRISNYANESKNSIDSAFGIAGTSSDYSSSRIEKVDFIGVEKVSLSVTANNIEIMISNEDDEYIGSLKFIYSNLGSIYFFKGDRKS